VRLSLSPAAVAVEVAGFSELSLPVIIIIAFDGAGRIEAALLQKLSKTAIARSGIPQ
jgi:uncharacterized membrane protein YqjE